MSSISNYEKEFRQAAHDGNTAKMIELLDKNIDINSKGPDSLRSAAHCAAVAGKIHALRLLLNLGAQFEERDKNGQTPEALAHASARDFFNLIGLAKTTILARKAFYPHTIDHNNATDKLSNSAWHEHLLEKRAFFGDAAVKKIFDSYRGELPEAKKNVTEKDVPVVQQFATQMNQCLLELRRIQEAQVTLSEALKNGRQICACGEAAATSYAFLVHQAKVQNPVEEINLVLENTNNPRTPWGHAAILLDRNQDKPLNDLSGWKDAFIIDTFNERFFFHEFIDQYTVDTGFKSVAKFKLILGASNRITPFPQMLPFPQTAALFDKTVQEIHMGIAHSLSQRR